MCTEVYRHQHIETGGNLFGLWTTSGSAVIHVVLGPGKNCRRTTTSFHQDIEYLHRVGRFVNDNYMLCHIGEWHSHHSLALNKPSSGDEETVRRNFPQRVTNFLIIFANIKNRDTIVLSPYFFTNEGRRYKKVEYVFLDSNGPYSNDDKILEQIQLGAEKEKYQQRKSIHSEAPSTITESQRSTSSKSQQSINACPTYSQVVSSGSPQNSRNAASNAQSQQNNETSSQATSTYRQPSRRNPNGVTLRDTSGSIADYPSLQSGIVQSQPVNDENKATQKDVVLKEVYDDLQNCFGSEINVEIELTRCGDVQMQFEHAKKYWLIRFPETFPDRPAKILFASKSKISSGLSQSSHYYLEKPVTNHVNILLSIRNNCSLTCKICENINEKTLTESAEIRPVSTTVVDVNEKC